MEPEKTVHVLIADDDPAVGDSVALIVRRSLRDYAPVVYSAASPDEALVLIGSIPVDARRVIVIADYNMGTTQNGLDLLGEVARRRPDALRVLMSGYPKKDFEAQFPHAGLDAFVDKPWDKDQLGDMLRSMARGLPSPGAFHV